MLLQGFPEAQRLAYLSRGVHDPYEDSRQLGRHVTGPQEAVDAPQRCPTPRDIGNITLQGTITSHSKQRGTWK